MASITDFPPGIFGIPQESVRQLTFNFWNSTASNKLSEGPEFPSHTPNCPYWKPCRFLYNVCVKEHEIPIALSTAFGNIMQWVTESRRKLQIQYSISFFFEVP